MLTLDLYAAPAGVAEEMLDFRRQCIKTYKREDALVSEREIRALFDNALAAKGDWLETKFVREGDCVHIEITLLLFSEIASKENQRLFASVINLCDGFLERVPAAPAIQDDPVLEAPGEELGIVQIVERGGTGISLEKLQESLKENGLFSMVSYQKSGQIECGASGGGQEFLLFVGAAVMSGITWDVIKQIISFAPGIHLDEIAGTVIQKRRFKSLKKEVAKQLKIDVDEIRLIRFDEKKERLCFQFAAKDLTVDLSCGKDYRIKHFKVREKPVL